MKRNIISILDLENELDAIIDLAIKLKNNGSKQMNALKGKKIAMIFERPSLRTRLSFELATKMLGGISINFGEQDIQIGVREEPRDVALVLSRYCDLIIYRSLNKDNLIDIANYAEIPVINGLDIHEHPCQILADLMTIREKKGKKKKLNFVFIGNGKNNLVNSYMLGCPLSGYNMKLICHKNYQPEEYFIEKSYSLSRKNGTDLVITDDLNEINDADIIASDTWISYWDQTKRNCIINDLRDYTITQEIIDRTNVNSIFLHCMPIYYGQEVEMEVAHSERSMIIDEAENRLWTAMALLTKLVDNKN